MTTQIDEIANYIMSDPESLGLEPDVTGKPAILAGIRKHWPDASDEEIAKATKAAIGSLQQRASSCFAEADALDALHAARVRSSAGGRP